MSPTPQQRRENPEPREARNPVPVAVIALVSAMLGWAAGYLMAAHPNADASLGDQRTALHAAPAVAATDSAPAPADGAALYATHCVACHQASGAGLPGVFPPLSGSEWVLGDEDTLLQILLHGVSGQISVAGTTYQGSMPAFGERFSDEEIAALATHLRASWGNTAAAVDAAAAARARASTAGRSTPWAGGEELTARAP
ncbi:cytochrome c [bacterium BD-1]|uniref:c-type cytochrome n=1 Tax=Arenimonas sp. TaxID=1872635 RepID=UPI001E3FF2B4|nr:cytochrome c [Ottowia caeni]